MGVLKTNGKEYYYFVSGMTVPKYMVSDELEKNIDNFIDWVSKKTDNLEKLAEENMMAFTYEMEHLYPMLCEIHAHWLEMEAARILRLTEANSGELSVKLVAPFVTNLRTLAMDIQMAQRNNSEFMYRQYNEVGRYRNVVSSMKIVLELLDCEDYERAFDFVVNVDDIQSGEYYMPLVTGISTRNLQQAKQAANTLLTAFIKKIDETILAAYDKIALKKILIVDDVNEVLTALSLMLKEHYQVFAFTSGSQALTFIDTKHVPDAFLLDITMPNMDGFTLAKKIRSRPRYEETPILFLTGDSKRETFMKSMLYNAKAFIVKPASKDLIISKLNDCFES